MTSQLDERYLSWLYDQTGLPKRNRGRTFYKLTIQMHLKEFVWIVSGDSNRAEDGKELRWEFVKASRLKKVDAEWLYRPCSVLEMFVALTRRLAFLTDSDPYKWFQQLLHNIRLEALSDIYADGAIVEMEEKLESLIWRTYDPDGEGGLFPLRNPIGNQRGVEIWNQMNAWLIERDRRES